MSTITPGCRKLAEEHEIQGFPTIKFFKEMIPMEYTGLFLGKKRLFETFYEGSREGKQTGAFPFRYANSCPLLSAIAFV